MAEDTLTDTSRKLYIGNDASISNSSGLQNTCVGGESISIGKWNLLSTGSGCTAIGYSNLSCSSFGSGCENTIVGQAFSPYKDR